MRVERVVLDTHVLIGSALTKGTPYEVLKWVQSRAVLIFSDPTFAELADRLMKLKFDRYVGREQRLEFIADVANVAEWAVITGALRVCRDPEDDKLPETALAGQADCIVSGDEDLLVLDPFAGMRIVSPSGFFEELE